MESFMYAALAAGGFALFLLSVVRLHRERRRAYEAECRAAKQMFWKLEMEGDYERTRQRW